MMEVLVNALLVDSIVAGRCRDFRVVQVCNDIKINSLDVENPLVNVTQDRFKFSAE